MKRFLNKSNIGIVGLGLMGGAIALALRNKCGVEQKRLFACDKDVDVLLQAEKTKLISQGWSADKAGELLLNCDLVFLCLNPSSILCFLERWGGFFKNNCLVTDIAGTKESIAQAGEKLREDIDFIPGHPMAGAHIKHKTGFSNASLCDFTGKNYILAPIARNRPENLNFLKDLIYKMGFANITEVSPAEHDRKIAFTSQLCHVIAASLIDCEADTTITRFGGGSFEDLTRIAMLNAPMWTELFIENRSPLLERIEQFEKSLCEFKTLIGEAKAGELEKRLATVCDRRTEMTN